MEPMPRGRHWDFVDGAERVCSPDRGTEFDQVCFVKISAAAEHAERLVAAIDHQVRALFGDPVAEALYPEAARVLWALQYEVPSAVLEALRDVHEVLGTESEMRALAERQRNQVLAHYEETVTTAIRRYQQGRKPVPQFLKSALSDLATGCDPELSPHRDPHPLFPPWSMLHRHQFIEGRCRNPLCDGERPR